MIIVPLLSRKILKSEAGSTLVNSPDTCVELEKKSKKSGSIIIYTRVKPSYICIYVYMYIYRLNLF